MEAKVAIGAAILGLSAMACVIGFLVLVWLGIKSLQPSPSRAAFEFHNKLHLDAFRQWADQQFEIAKTNRSENLTIPGKAAKVPLLSGNSISFEPATGADDPCMWAILEFGGWGGTTLFVYPTNSAVNYSDKNTFLVTNQIYIRFTTL